MGGEVVASGTPESVAQEEDSHTGRYLRGLLPAVDLEGPRPDRKTRAVEGESEATAGAGDD